MPRVRLFLQLVWTLLLAMTYDNGGFDVGRSGAAEPAGYDRPAGNSGQSRSVVITRHGMVAASHPLAAQVGLDVLRAGGTAADAAIAVNAMLAVVEPMSCGVGGDLFAIYFDSETEQLYGLNASGRSPRSLNRAVFAELGLEQIPTSGPLSWSVPGCVSGWDALQRRFGRLSFAEALTPAAQTAEEGFPVAEIVAAAWQGSASGLSEWPDARATFLPNGKAPHVGQVITNPRFAATLRTLIDRGAREFYQGEIAGKIVRFSEQHGGYFALADFAEHRADWVEPVSTNYRGYDVWELPPNGQGIAVLQMLNLLEAYDLKSLGPVSAEYLHLLVEAKKLAFADRARFYADPDFGKLPIAELISKAYAERRGKLIDPDRAASDVPPGDPQLAHGDTVYLSVVDKDRNCCSLIQSVYNGFGSKVVPGDLGFALQNRGALFALSDDHPNRLEPGKRPFHTIIPAMVTKEGKPWLVFGVMGGDMQPQGHVQVLVNLIDFGMNVQTAGDTARVNHMGSPTPTGLRANGSGTLLVESTIPEETVSALRAKGHRIARGRGAFGGYQGIRIDWENGTLHGATEPRKDGTAAGY